MKIENILVNVIYCFNLVIPKRKNQVFFYSTPDYSDNARAIYSEMLRQGLNKKYRIVWALKNPEKYKSVMKDVVIVKHRTVRNLWHFCRSKYIFRTHSLWGNKYVSNRQKMCIAWHGMPVKKLVQPDGKIKPIKCDILTSTAPFFDKELAESMGMSEDVCKHVGLPRNDDLFLGGNELSNKYPNYKKRIIWMPTFRNAGGFKDGIDTELGIPCVSRDELSRINDVLVRQNYLLILKLHPWSAEKLDDINFSNIVNLKDSDIDGNASLYTLIGQTDALITDYSSIYIDYLLVDKPICFAYDDIQEYRATRGFAFEPIESFMPGPVVSDCEQLICWFDELEKEDLYAEKRKTLKKLFFVSSDGQSSRRVLVEMGIVP